MRNEGLEINLAIENQARLMSRPMVIDFIALQLMQNYFLPNITNSLTTISVT